MRPRITLLACCGLLAGCSVLQNEQTLRVLPPAPPTSWQAAFPRLAFLVTARDGAGSLVEAAGSDRTEPVLIACARTLNAPVLAWPYVPRGAGALAPGVLRPAGGLFPRDLRSWHGEAVLELTWEDGAAALVLDRAAAAGEDLSRFNAERLCAYMRREGDPWNLDLDLAAQRITEGRFTAWDLDRLELRQVRVGAGPGSWFMESPFSRPVAAADGAVSLGEVALGSHRLFSLAGACLRLQVGRGEVLVLPGP